MIAPPVDYTGTFVICRYLVPLVCSGRNELILLEVFVVTITLCNLAAQHILVASD